MSNVSSLFRSLFIYSICLPLAVFLGYLMANPFDLTTFSVVGLLGFLLIVPLLLRWHHLWLIATWNTSMVLFFLPGRPQFWMALAWFSLLIGVGQYILNRNLKFLPAAVVVRPLLLLTVVVLITAKCTGGVGLRTFGGDTYGGKKYITLFTAIAGFFALTGQRIPPNRALFFVGLFFLGAITQAIGDMGSMVNPAFYFLFLLFPLSGMINTASDSVVSTGFIARLGGLSLASSAVFCAMLSRYGIQDLFTLRRVGRLAIFVGFVMIGMMGGFRSMLVLCILTFMVLFYLEGLIRSTLMPIFLITLFLGTALLVPFVGHLPLSMQRTLSFLPLQIDPVAKASADASTEWRVAMWKHLLPQIPDYLILGKGYSINAGDYNMLKGTAVRGGDTGSVGAELAGDYHNGPLSVIIPFGIFGVIAFVWFLIAGVRLLRQNYENGDPTLRHVNRFLLAYFLAKIVFFLGIFGSLYSDLASFTGLLGLSVCLNGGVVKPVVVPQPKLVFNRFKLHPEGRRALGAS